jgi:type IV secretory pathway VirB2 component (pilin)
LSTVVCPCQASVSSLGWDIALAVLLAIGVVFTADSQSDTRTDSCGQI